MTLTHTTFVVDRRPGADWLTLNRPDRLNAITPTMANELADYFLDLHERPEVRVVVLHGAGKAFCAGLDIKARVNGEEPGRTERLPELIRSMRSCPQPIVALVHGAAAGGGFSIALAADVRIAGESARMNVAYIRLGTSGCELGTSYFLPKIVGLSAAAELMYTGRFLHAPRAHQLGLVSAVVPDSQLEVAGEALVAEMLGVAPLALRKTKETLAAAQRLADLDEVLELEMATQKECAASPDFREALEAFVEKRPPRFTT